MKTEEEFCTCDRRAPAPRPAGDTRRRWRASTTFAKLFGRVRRFRVPPEQSRVLNEQEQGTTKSPSAVQNNSRVVLQINAVHVVQAEHGEAPTMLTAGYQGWWRTPKLHLRLRLERVAKAALRRRQQQQPGAGLEKLEEWFPWGRGPALRVKGNSRTLVLRLYTRRRLTARAEVPLGELLSRTAEGVASVPLQVKEGGAVQQAVVEVVQVSPHPKALPPPLCPLMFSQEAPLLPHQLQLPPPANPTPFRLKQLVRDMCGPPLDDTDWSQPLQFSRQPSPDGDTTITTTTGTTTGTTTNTNTSTTASTDGPEAAFKDATRTDGGAAPARRSSSRQYHEMLPGVPAPRSVPRPSLCMRVLRFVLFCLWVLAGYKIVTDLTVAVHQTVHWAFDTTQDTERPLACWTPAQTNAPY